MALDPWSNETVGGLVDRRAREAPERIAFLTESEQISWQELRERSLREARLLADLGVRKSDRVVMSMPNGIDTVSLYVAIARLGAISVFINREYSGDLLDSLLRNLRPAMLIMDPQSLAKVDKECVESLRASACCISGSFQASAEPLFDRTGGPVRGPSSIALPQNIAATEAVQFIFTSGTTGLPKACVLSHRARISLSAQINACLGVTVDDRFFGCLPNYHGNLFLAIMGAIVSGASCVIAERFSKSRYWPQVATSGATILVLHGVPVNLLLAEKDERESEEYRARALLTIGGRWPEFVERFGLTSALVGYGSTEAGGLTAMACVRSDEMSEKGPSFVGRVRSDLEVTVVGDDGGPRSPGQSGEILVRPRIPSVIFDGYFGVAQEERDGQPDPWYRSGDQGHFDEQGNLHFTGRIRDAIRVKGEFIPVEYLESLIRQVPEVADCAAVGVHSPLGEEELRLFVQRRTACELQEGELIGFLQSRVPKFMVPQSVVFVDDFPRSPATLKILKRQLTG